MSLRVQAPQATEMPVGNARVEHNRAVMDFAQREQEKKEYLRG